MVSHEIINNGNLMHVYFMDTLSDDIANDMNMYIVWIACECRHGSYTKPMSCESTHMHAI